jgi:hypothetical protein
VPSCIIQPVENFAVFLVFFTVGMANSTFDDLEELLEFLEPPKRAPKPRPPRVTRLSHNVRQAPILVRPPSAFLEAPGTFFSVDNQLPAEIWKVIFSHCCTFKPKEILDFMGVCGFWYHSIRFLDDFWHEKFFTTLPLHYSRLETNVLRHLRDPEPPDELVEVLDELMSGTRVPSVPFTGVIDWYFLFMNYYFISKKSEKPVYVETNPTERLDLGSYEYNEGLWLENLPHTFIKGASSRPKSEDGLTVEDDFDIDEFISKITDS